MRDLGVMGWVPDLYTHLWPVMVGVLKFRASGGSRGVGVSPNATKISENQRNQRIFNR